MKSKQFAKVNGRVIRMAVASAIALSTTALSVDSYATGSNSATLAVNATVITNCTISTAALGFGNYDPAGANLSTAKEGTGTVSVRCTDGTAATVSLDNGLNASGGRRMTDGTHFLSYSLFSDTNRTVAWGNTVGTNTVPHAGNGLTADLTVYGRIAAGQNVPAGAYSDTVVATIDF